MQYATDILDAISSKQPHIRGMLAALETSDTLAEHGVLDATDAEIATVRRMVEKWDEQGITHYQQARTCCVCGNSKDLEAPLFCHQCGTSFVAIENDKRSTTRLIALCIALAILALVGGTYLSLSVGETLAQAAARAVPIIIAASAIILYVKWTR